jgi:hypothetical protein
MQRAHISWIVLGISLAMPAATPLPAQSPNAVASMVAPARNPDVAANPGIENMYVPPMPAQPFTAKATVTWTKSDSTPHELFMSMLARDSSGRIYFENRRTFNENGEPRPRWSFTIIDPQEKTRTNCYVNTKTCRIDAFRRVSYEDSEKVEDLGRARTVETANLGTSVIDALTVEGMRETTSVAAGAYNNTKPMVITREIWHSTELNLDITISKTDPRTGTNTRKLEILSRNEPDPEYFTIPKDYTILDNRPPKKKSEN